MKRVAATPRTTVRRVKLHTYPKTIEKDLILQSPLSQVSSLSNSSSQQSKPPTPPPVKTTAAANKRKVTNATPVPEATIKTVGRARKATRTTKPRTIY